MHIKRFKAGTLEEALKEVKTAFGPEAVIISTKNGAGMAEVTAAKDFEVEDLVSDEAPETLQTPEAFEASLEASLEASFEISNDIFRDGLTEIKDEIKQLRQLFSSLVGDSSKKEVVEIGSAAFRAYEEFIRKGVNEKLTRRLVKMAAVVTSDGPEEVKRRCFRLLMERSGFYNPLAARGGTKMLALVGPTGSGKTTTIAKLAGALKQKHNAKVGVLSLGGSGADMKDALKECGRLTDFSFATPETKEDLNSALWDVRDKDVILIDTPGLNPMDHGAIDKLEPLFSCGLPIKLGLVLSVTNSEESQYEACRGFKRLPLDCMVYTKLDEGSRFGAIMNTSALLKKPVAYLCSGQKIPYDISVANSELLENLVLNGREQRI